MSAIQDDTYDPDLHGDTPVPQPARWQIAALTIAAVTAPFLVWWIVSAPSLPK